MNLKLKLNRIGMKMQEKSPEILLVGGIVCTVASTVTACRATLKADKIINESKKNLEKVDEARKIVIEDDQPELYTAEDALADRRNEYIKLGFKLVKEYAVPTVLGISGILMLVKGQSIQKDRYIAASAALASVTTAFSQYRQNINHMITRGDLIIADENTTPEEIDNLALINGGTRVDENGNVVLNGHHETKGSGYATIFSKHTSDLYQHIAFADLAFLKSQENYLTTLLQARGKLYLNQVYDALGLEMTKAGQIVGWLSDGDGDCCIDLRIKEITLEDGSIEYHIDPNVDGDIWSLLSERGGE